MVLQMDPLGIEQAPKDRLPIVFEEDVQRCIQIKAARAKAAQTKMRFQRKLGLPELFALASSMMRKSS